jgi:ketosteroid isomerase-like protein
MMQQFFLIMSALSTICSNASAQQQTTNVEHTIRAMHRQYIEAWLQGDESGVLSLFEEGARIQPSSLRPIDSIRNIQAFWFPKDSSETIIHRFTSNILHLERTDTLVIATQSTFLEWTYRKGSNTSGAEQHGVATTLYRKQSSGSWKIWRQMWTDIHTKKK